jgi:hypothetical protein
MATEKSIIDFEAALEFFENSFDLIGAQKEHPDTTQIELLKISLERLAFTSEQIEKTSNRLLVEIEFIQIRKASQGPSVPVARDTQKEVEESEDDIEALATGDLEEFAKRDPYWESWEKRKEQIRHAEKRNNRRIEELKKLGYVDLDPSQIAELKKLGDVLKTDEEKTADWEKQQAEKEARERQADLPQATHPSEETQSAPASNAT